MKGLVNGFFNPIHRGHLMLINEAWFKCTHLTVLVNNDGALKTKGSIPFYDEETRLAIIGNLKRVDLAVLSTDNPFDDIKRLAPDVVFQGVDKSNETLPDDLLDLYEQLGVKVEYIGGIVKVESSSSLIKRAAEEYNRRNDLLR